MVGLAHAHAGAAAGRGALEVGDERAGGAVAHAPIPVGGVGIVEVVGHFHAAHAQEIGKEGVRALNVCTNGGDVVHTVLQGHGGGDCRHGFGPGGGLDAGFIAVVDEHLRRGVAEGLA